MRTDAFALRDDPGPRGSARLLTVDEAAELFPPIYERIRVGAPGYISRSEDWWRSTGSPIRSTGATARARKYLRAARAGRRAGRVRDVPGPVEVGGRDAEGRGPRRRRVRDLAGGEAELWRFLFGVDLVERVKWCAAIRHGRSSSWSSTRGGCTCRVSDGLWLRLVDLEAALRARSVRRRRAGRARGLRRVSSRRTPGAGRSARRSRADRRRGRRRARRRRLASAYLGAFSFERLAAAGRARELRPGRARPRERALRDAASALLPRGLLARL